MAYQMNVQHPECAIKVNACLLWTVTVPHGTFWCNHFCQIFMR